MEGYDGERPGGRGSDASGVSLRYESTAHWIAWFRNVQIVLSSEAPTIKAMTEIARQLELLGVACPGGHACLLIVQSTVRPPSQEIRKFIAQKLAASTMTAAAQVVLGTGFRGAAMRSMLSVLQLALRPPYSMGIYGSVSDAASWLHGQLVAVGAPTPSAVQLHRVAQGLVSRFRESQRPDGPTFTTGC